MYLNKLLSFASPIFPFDDACFASINITDAGACNNGHVAAFVEIEEEFDRNFESCQSGFCASLDYAPSEGPMGMCSCGIVFCSNAAYRAPTVCDEGEEYLLSLAQLVKCTVDAAKDASQKRKDVVITVNNEAPAKEGRDASQSCQEDVVACEEDVLKSVTKSWATRYCFNYIEKMLSPEISPSGEYAWMEECGTDHPTLTPLISLCMEVFSSNVIDEDEGIITYIDTEKPEGTPQATAEPSSATTYAFASASVAGWLFLSPIAMLYI
uniref:Uncharacterized protein n=1 Tax=Skeletonema marinoi TaxID=267567 RepID=A0A7S2LRM5_9STRA|mmetsp:Transcript_28193/g.47825  ORF Transcript_28193/g.47825 Transcript_28193/m.47825 type:complete len:267 (+) Transcript_28193:61-861(+)